MQYNVFGLGNALVDSEYVLTDKALESLGVQKGIMELVEADQLAHILSVLSRNDELGGELHKQTSGGSAGNTIVGIQNFGNQCFYACRIADDPIGKVFVEDMNDSGVAIDTKLATMDSGHSGQCMVLVTPDGERTMNTYLGVSSELTISNINEDALKQSEFLYLEGYMASLPNSIEAACHAKKIIQSQGGKVALSFSDPAMTQFCKAGLEEIIMHNEAGVDVLMCNQEEALTYTGTSDIEDALTKLGEISPNVVVTLGPAGSIALVNGERYQAETSQVKAINTNGAGDTFAGAYVHAVIQQLPVEQALALANASATQVVTQYGPRLSKQQQDDIKQRVTDLTA